MEREGQKIGGTMSQNGRSEIWKERGYPKRKRGKHGPLSRILAIGKLDGSTGKLVIDYDNHGKMETA